jgi:hypothetical protein
LAGRHWNLQDVVCGLPIWADLCRIRRLATRASGHSIDQSIKVREASACEGDLTRFNGIGQRQLDQQLTFDREGPTVCK